MKQSLDGSNGPVTTSADGRSRRPLPERVEAYSDNAVHQLIVSYKSDSGPVDALLWVAYCSTCNWDHFGYHDNVITAAVAHLRGIPA